MCPKILKIIQHDAYNASIILKCLAYYSQNYAAIIYLNPGTRLVQCIYWCSVLGGFITPADSSSTSLGIGLFITLIAERGMPGWLWGAVAQWSEHLQLKQEALGWIPGGCPGFFFLSAGILM